MSAVCRGVRRSTICSSAASWGRASIATNSRPRSRAVSLTSTASSSTPASTLRTTASRDGRIQTYVADRMSGFGGESNRRRPQEFSDFPLFADMLMQRFPRRGKQFNAPQAIADVHYKDLSAINREIALLQNTAKAAGTSFSDCFMTAPSPGIIASTLLNAHYPTPRITCWHSPRNAQRVSGDPSGRLYPADRRPRSRHGPPHHLPGQDGGGVRGRLRAAGGGDQYRDHGHPARAGAPPLLLGQLGGAAHSRHRVGQPPAHPDQSRGRRPQHRIQQSAAPARICGAAALQASRRG